MKKIVYIAHPISGNIEENLKDIIRILRIINTNSHPKHPFRVSNKIDFWHTSVEPNTPLIDYLGFSKDEYIDFVRKESSLDIYNFENIIPVCPYYADILSLDDTKPEERARGIENDVALIRRGFFDECWLTGNKISFGMNEEIKLFQSLVLPVVNYVGKI